MPSSIDDILVRPNDVLVETRRHRSRLGYFATLYRNIPARVKAAIEDGAFDDAAHMKRLDVRFAERYLDALAARGTEDGPPRAWARTFVVAERWRPLILQHLLLGVNAPTNLNLGIAADVITTEDSLPVPKNDFDRINQILGALIEDVQTRAAAVSPWIGTLNRLAGRVDEVISNVCSVQAREDAWAFATTLAGLDADERRNHHGRGPRDGPAHRQNFPGGPWALPHLVWIWLWETNPVPAVLSTLSRTSPVV
jgi:hypothetical protein